MGLRQVSGQADDQSPLSCQGPLSPRKDLMLGRPHILQGEGRTTRNHGGARQQLLPDRYSEHEPGG